MEAGPIATIVETVRLVRPDWRADQVAALFRRRGIPREQLLRALAAGCQATTSDGAYLLCRPDDVLDGTWLIAAQAEMDRQDAADRAS